MIKGRYHIADCEHNGDINSAIAYINRLGGKVTDRYWDGHDCGEAYLDIEVSVDLFKKLYNRQSFHFDADILDYVPKRCGDLEGYNNVPYEQVKAEKERRYYDCSKGFEQRLTIYACMFDLTQEKAKQHLKVLLEKAGEGSRVLLISNRISRENVELFSYEMLIEVNGFKLDVLDNFRFCRYYDWFRPYFGHLELNHYLNQMHCDYRDVYKLMKAVAEEKPLYFHKKDVYLPANWEVPYSVYCKDGKFGVEGMKYFHYRLREGATSKQYVNAS